MQLWSWLRDWLPPWLGGEQPRIELMFILDDERRRIVAIRTLNIRIRQAKFSHFVRLVSLRFAGMGITDGRFRWSYDRICAVFVVRNGDGVDADSMSEVVLNEITRLANEIGLPAKKAPALTTTEALQNPSIAKFNITEIADQVARPPGEVTQIIAIEPHENL